MALTPHDLIARLEREGSRLVSWARAAEPSELTWKPAAERWSMLEVVGHLCDEERDDFRARIGMTLAGTKPWPAIDPEGAVVNNGWQRRRPGDAIDEFEAERQISLTWLRSQGEANWQAAYDHPEVGPVYAVDLLAAWVAHDLLHGRQLARLRVDAFRSEAAPLSIRYADPSALD